MLRRTGNMSNPLEDLLVGVGVTPPDSRSSLFSKLSLRQRPNRQNLPKKEFTFHHAGWTADTECKC
jgi:hypothetical protein